MLTPRALLVLPAIVLFAAAGCPRDGHDHASHDDHAHGAHDDGEHDHAGHDHGDDDHDPFAPLPDNVPPIPEEARRVPVTVSNDGYDPATVEAAPGETVVLVLERVVDSACTRDFVVRGTEYRVALPVDEKVEFPITAPEEGEQGFHCGHDMLRGKVVVTAAD